MAELVKNIVWHSNKVNYEQRCSLNGHKSCILWFTGLPSAGKSSLAMEIEMELFKLNTRSYVLDGDNIRCGISKNLGFSVEERTENIRRVSEVAKLFQDSGLLTIVAMISPLRIDREAAQRLCGPHFHEVYIKCASSICEERDQKGHYKKAREGLIKNFTGISSPYEEPLNPEIVIESDKQEMTDSVQQIIRFLTEKGYIQYT